MGPQALAWRLLTPRKIPQALAPSFSLPKANPQALKTLFCLPARADQERTRLTSYRAQRLHTPPRLLCSSIPRAKPSHALFCAERTAPDRCRPRPGFSWPAALANTATGKPRVSAQTYATERFSAVTQRKEDARSRLDARRSGVARVAVFWGEIARWFGLFGCVLEESALVGAIVSRRAGPRTQALSQGTTCTETV
jgi:hypothetical protein